MSPTAYRAHSTHDVARKLGIRRSIAGLYWVSPLTPIRLDQAQGGTNQSVPPATGPGLTTRRRALFSGRAAPPPRKQRAGSSSSRNPRFSTRSGFAVERHGRVLPRLSPYLTRRARRGWQHHVATGRRVRHPGRPNHRGPPRSPGRMQQRARRQPARVGGDRHEHQHRNAITRGRTHPRVASGASRLSWVPERTIGL